MAASPKAPLRQRIPRNIPIITVPDGGGISDERPVLMIIDTVVTCLTLQRATTQHTLLDVLTDEGDPDVMQYLRVRDRRRAQLNVYQLDPPIQWNEVRFKSDRFIALNKEDLLKSRTKTLLPHSQSIVDVLPGDLDNSQSIHLLVERCESTVASVMTDDDQRREILKAREEEIDHGVKASAPSSAATDFIPNQTKHPIWNGRTPSHGTSYHGPPIQIYHPAFGQFKDALASHTLTPTPDDYKLSHELCTCAPVLYADARERKSALFETDAFSRVFGSWIHDIKCPGETMPDGAVNVMVEGEDTIMWVDALLVQFANEIGVGRADPSIRLAQTARKLCVQESMKGILNVSCCPMFLVSFAGPWMMISGAVFADRFIVQPLTDWTLLNGDPFFDERVRKLAHTCRALHGALDSIIAFYKSLKPSVGHWHHSPASAFPYITSFNNADGGEGTYTLEYTGRLFPAPEETHRALFTATSAERRPVVVKFTTRYAGTAHRLLASHGLAPALYACETIPGGLKMVVMDRISGEPLGQDAGPLSGPALSDVKRAVEILHADGWVFGDLRRNNIIIVIRSSDCASGEGEDEDEDEDRDEKMGIGTTGRGRAMLVDFDWCDVDGEGRYPVVLNDRGDIVWHPDVERGGVMRKAHDLYMLDMMARDKDTVTDI